MEIAMEEAVVNVINHAKSSAMSIYFKHEPNQTIEFRVKDNGPPFNPLDVIQTIQTEWELEEREPGGLGLTIIRNYMDVLLYRREGEQNILILIKNLSTD
jgi:anti-sigma regulatory factor (Ser/Thr protein kinase)